LWTIIRSIVICLSIALSLQYVYRPQALESQFHIIFYRRMSSTGYGHRKVGNYHLFYITIRHIVNIVTLFFWWGFLANVCLYRYLIHFDFNCGNTVDWQRPSLRSRTFTVFKIPRSVDKILYIINTRYQLFYCTLFYTKHFTFIFWLNGQIPRLISTEFCGNLVA